MTDDVPSGGESTPEASPKPVGRRVSKPKSLPAKKKPTPKKPRSGGGKTEMHRAASASPVQRAPADSSPRREAIGSSGNRLLRTPTHSKELSVVRPDGIVRGQVFRTLRDAVRKSAEPTSRDFARRLEEALYRTHRHHRVGYVRAARRLSWNLQVNGDRLLRDFSNPETLAAVGDRELARGTPAEQSILRGEERERKLREIIAGRGGLEQSNRSLLRCHRTPACRNALVDWQEVQSRAADEAATITATCLACGARWKLS